LKNALQINIYKNQNFPVVIWIITKITQTLVFWRTHW